MPAVPESRHAVLSGCSGGGKSTLLDALARCGFATVPEPGRRIVAQEEARDGRALPWVDMGAFARRALDMAARDRAFPARGWVFFDRGLVDAAVALERAEGIAVRDNLAGLPRYHARVFLTPPWRALYRTDAARRHGWEAAVAEYDRLTLAYAALGYRLTVLPKCTVTARVAYVRAALGL